MNETEIFSKALRLNSASERNDFLEDVCRGDSELRQRLEALLMAHEAPMAELEPPGSISETIDWAECERVGGRIGPYKLLQQIGEGGMGVVFMAEQIEPVKRRVAVKIIKPGMDSRRIVARFEAERQAIAMMDHPNIAKVLDAGTTGAGRPYFVMELVNGLPINEYCDQKKLPPRERLSLFVAVCKGIQHAHQKGIIHRDLKPSNILVADYDETPVPKIIDFGVAKAVGQQLTDKTVFTEFGQIIGTLEYMSPEQAKRNQIDVDTRSDIYSLGIVLYSLLTGETPFEAQRLKDVAWEEMLRIIREEDPVLPSLKLSSSQKLAEAATNRQVDPSKLPSLVRGDLDWIVMKSLQKDRSRRYASANELAEDVSRHLSAEPVLARPPSLLDRCEKFIQRNRASVLAASLAVLAVSLTVLFVARQQRQVLLEKSSRTSRLSSNLQQASLALGKALNVPLGLSTEWGAVESWQEQIGQLLNEGPVESEMAELAEQTLGEIAKARAERELGDTIEEVLLAGATNMDLKSWQQMKTRLEELFAKNGMDLITTPPDEVARRIRSNPFSSRWTDALELWVGTQGQMASLGGPKLTKASMQPWAEAMYAADSDPLRTGIRQQIYGGRPDADALNQLTAAADLSQHTPRGLSWLAVAYSACKAYDRADEIFELALQRFPQDVMLNYDYALTLAQQKRHQEAIRMYCRCVALRPDIHGFWNSLATQLDKVGEPENAARARRRAEENE